MSVIALEGPQDPDVPLLVDSPHSGDVYPDDFQPLVGPDRYRRAEDMDVDVLLGAAPTLGVPLLHALFPRIYVDVNRALADISPDAMTPPFPFQPLPSAKARLGKGVIWMEAPPVPSATGDQPTSPLYAGPLSGEAVAHRLATYWTPYRTRLSELLAAIHARHGRAFYLDGHSMQSVSTAMHEEGAGKPRPDVVLGDRDGTSCDPAYTGARQAGCWRLQGFEVSVNEPYKGADLTISHGRPGQGYHALQIELRRDLYMDETTMARNARGSRRRGGGCRRCWRGWSGGCGREDRALRGASARPSVEDRRTEGVRLASLRSGDGPFARTGPLGSERLVEPRVRTGSDEQKAHR